MFSVTIAFGASNVPWTLLYKTEDQLNSAKSTFEMSPPGSVIRLRDDYGQEISIDRNSIHAVMFEDMRQSKMAHIERALFQKRMEIEANNMGRADPAIAAAMQSRGPSVITPAFGPNGAFPRP
jgi:hypothetical protein